MTKTQNRGRRTAKGGDSHSFLLMSTLTLRTLLNPLGFQIILRNIFNQLVQKSFLSTPQHGSSMINQNSWIRYFYPNDVLWKEPDVGWRTRAMDALVRQEVVARGGRMDRRSFSWVSLIVDIVLSPKFCIGSFLL